MGAISAVDRAIQALKESKTALGGKAEREALVEVKATVAKVLSAEEVARLGDVLGAMQPGKAYTYKYKSNDIISTLEGLTTTFRNRKLELEDTEFQTNSAHELKQQSLSNEQKFKQKEKNEKEAVRDAKAEDKEATEADKAQEIRSCWRRRQASCTAQCLLWPH